MVGKASKKVTKIVPVEEVKEDSEEKKDVKGQETQERRESDAKKVAGIKDQSRVALAALRKYFADRGGKSLFPDIDHSLNLSVVYKKPAMVTDRLRAKILLPHSSRTISNTSVCIFMPDLDQTEKGRTDPDVDKQARQWAEQIEKDHGLTGKHYAKLMTKRQLERECHSYRERRALASLYDVFLVDARCAKSVNTFLGKEFHRVHKIPLWFEYSKPLSTAINEALSTVTFPLNRYMTRSCVSVGHLGQESADLAGNLDTVLDSVVAVCPGGLINIRSIYLQPTGSKPSLPIYVDEGAASAVQLASDKNEIRRSEQKITDECSTLPDGLKLEVRKNGKLRVLRDEDNHGIHYPTVNDEWDERDITKPTIDPTKLEKKRKNKVKKNRKRVAERLLKSGESVKVVPAKKAKA